MTASSAAALPPRAEPGFRAALALGAAALAAALAGFGLIGRWRDALTFPAGRDVLVACLPRLALPGLLSYGFLALNAAAIAYAWSGERRRLPFFLACLALFVAIRAVFVGLCPYGPLPGARPIYTGPLSWLRGVNEFDSELFFSGHAAVPYLYGLLASRRRASWAFFAASALMAAGVLVTRNHYTIDVLGAYFITYSIWRLAARLFARLDPPAAA